MNQGRGLTGGTETSKCGPSQLRWSLQFKDVKIVDLSHRSWPKDDPVTYQLLFGTMPLKPTYIQLQMADQTFRKVEDEYDPPIILRRPFLSTVKAIIYIGTGEVHMHFLSEKVRCYFTDLNYIVEDSKQVRTRRRQRNPKPEKENHQGRMGRLRRRSSKVRRHTAWTELSWGDRSTELGVEREDSYTRRASAAGTTDYAI